MHQQECRVFEHATGLLSERGATLLADPSHMYARMLCLDRHEDILGAHECLNDRTDLLGKQFLNLRPPAEIFNNSIQLAQA